MSNLFEGMEKPFLPMLISNWVFGIGIIEYPIRKPRKVVSFIYTAIILSAYLYMSYVSYHDYAVTKLARISPITTVMFYYSNICVTISVLVAGWFQSQGLHQCMLSAALSNQSLQKIGISKNHSKILKNELRRFLTFFSYIIAVITVNCTFTIIHNNLTVEQIIAMFVQNFPIVVVFIADSSFMNILGYAYYKFESLNDLLQYLLTSSPEVPLYREIAERVMNGKENQDAEEKDYSFIIKTAKLVHLQLTKLCREGNATYGFHTLISIAVAFTMMINNIFNVYLSLRSTMIASDVKVREIIRNMNWFLYFWVKTTTNSRFYTTVCNSAYKTGGIINEMYDEHNISENTKAEIRRFNIDLIQNKLKLSACGIVNIDLTLVPTMIATIITYFIIILQFQDLTYESSTLGDDEF